MPSYESSMRNLERADQKFRPPRPWRSPEESQMIQRLVFWWFTCRDAAGPRVVIGPGNSVSATRGFRNSFGNFRQTPARWDASKLREVIPDSRTSPVRGNTPNR